MNKLLTLLFCVVSFPVHAQSLYNFITFDPGSYTYYNNFIHIDTSYHHNLWQIGKPNKPFFSSAYTYPNVIVTDTLSPCSINDTSVFILKIPGTCINSIHSLEYLSFYYQLDIDSGSVAKVEVSENSGAHWTNLRDSLPQYYSWLSADTPNLILYTTGWMHYHLHRTSYSPVSDTILFRFTLITDNFYYANDGWIIDNIDFFYDHEDIPQIQNDNLISIYPNPSKGNIYIHSTEQSANEASVIVYDTKGQEVYKTDKLLPLGYLNLPLPDGTYTLKYLTKNEFCVEHIVIMK